MGLEIKTDLTFTELADLFGLDQLKAATLYKTAVLKLNTKSVIIESKDGSVLAVANVKLGVIKMAKEFKVGKATKEMVKGELEVAFDKAYKLVEPLGADEFNIKEEIESVFKDNPVYSDPASDEVLEAVFKYAVQEGNKVKAIKTVRTLTGFGLKQAKDLVEFLIAKGETEGIHTVFGDAAWADYQVKQDASGIEYAVKEDYLKDPEEEEFLAEVKAGVKKKKKKIKAFTASGKVKEGAMKQDTVLLKDATELFQPVGGSGGDSVYFAIAIGEDVNVGCRIRNGGRTSIRVEGAGISKDEVIDRLKGAGLNAASSEHWSLHMDIPTETMIQKAVGSILFAIGLPFEKLTANVTPIVGEGV